MNSHQVCGSGCPPRHYLGGGALNAEGKLVMQSVVATQASAILDFLHGLRGTLHVTFEEGTQSGGSTTCW